ncbi:MAG: vWA domain-containing protein [Vulcanimicrobiaceae bacterium]
MAEPAAELSRKISDFFALLREGYGFSTGQRETHDALRALDLLGISNPRRVRAALRTVACTSPEQIAIFEDAYRRIFLAFDDGIAQAAYAPRHSRPGTQAEPRADRTAHERATDPHDEAEEGAAGDEPAREHRVTGDMSDAAAAWMTLRARYSPAEGSAEPPSIDVRGLDDMESATRKLVRGVRLGRARRWTPQPHGPRFDVRRTLRASLQTGGDPAVLRRLGPPRRAPRIVLLVDGSRSMAEHASVLLQFAYTLGRATRRARIYAFSTGLHDLTRSLQSARPGTELSSLGESWGGGTRIGASLTCFLRDHGMRVLDDQTLVIIASDGLDASEGLQLERSMREIRRRSAGIVWLNPHARSHGFAPSAGGMRSAAPFIDVLDALRTARDVDRIAERVWRTRLYA